MFELVNQVYGNIFFSRGNIHEWYTRFKNRLLNKGVYHPGLSNVILKYKIIKTFVKKENLNKGYSVVS